MISENQLLKTGPSNCTKRTQSSFFLSQTSVHMQHISSLKRKIKPHKMYHLYATPHCKSSMGPLLKQRLKRAHEWFRQTVAKRHHPLGIAHRKKKKHIVPDSLPTAHPHPISTSIPTSPVASTA